MRWDPAAEYHKREWQEILAICLLLFLVLMAYFVGRATGFDEGKEEGAAQVCKSINEQLEVKVDC